MNFRIAARHFQKTMSSFVHSESRMRRKAHHLLERNIIPVLHMVSDERRHMLENKEDYYERLKNEYMCCLQKYPETFHVVNHHDSLFSGNAQQLGRTLIDMNEILTTAVVNNCKVIVNDNNNNNNNNMLSESRRLMDSYIYNFNTDNEANVYKMYDVTLEHDYDSIMDDIEIHRDHDVHMGSVLRVTNENDYDTVSDIIKYMERNRVNADVIIADDSNEHMVFIRVLNYSDDETVHPLQNQLPVTMNEILFTPDDRLYDDACELSQTVLC